jgi:hypothetical protein
MKLLISAFLSCIYAISLSNCASANPVSGESILCQNKNSLTMLGFSTREYNIGICKKNINDSSYYYYIGQNRNNKTQIFLPVTEQNNPYTENPWLLKASNGEFTYQVAHFNPLGTNQSVSISIFKNGRRIYHRITKNFISSDE